MTPAAAAIAAQRTISIRDCVARDGLQGERERSVADRVELIRRLAVAGLGDIEVASFVSPRAVPAMAGAADVVATLADVPELAGVRQWALVPNVKGAQLAVEAGVGRLTITVSASEQYSQKNTHMSTAQAMDQLVEIRQTASDAVLDVVISFCCGSAYDDELITPDDIAALAGHARDEGIDQVTLADTTGVATPRRIADVISATGADVGFHLHDTRATALLNAWTAIDHGITRFDTSLGGLGGSPFAPTAGGNLATEDLAMVLADAGIETGIDQNALAAIEPYLAELVGHDLPSRVATAGLLPKNAPSQGAA